MTREEIKTEWFNQFGSNKTVMIFNDGDEGYSKIACDEMNNVFIWYNNNEFTVSHRYCGNYSYQLNWELPRISDFDTFKTKSLTVAVRFAEVLVAEYARVYQSWKGK